jgi:hypothetical protein
MPTFWTNPTIVTQYTETGAEDAHILWDTENDFNEIKFNDNRSVVTNKPLYHIARSPKTDLTTKTYFIRATGYSFLNVPTTISGIELKLTGNRSGRITDDTISLCLNGENIGDNKATLNLDPIKFYGSSTDKWNTTLTPTDVLNSTFGVVIRFKSHPNWPHMVGAYLNSLELLIY